MIVVSGGKEYQRKYVKSIAEFCLNKLMPRKAENIYVEIKLKDLSKDDDLGYCFWADTNYRPREFDVELHKGMKLKRLLRSVAHEMVHVKQLARSELKYRVCNKTEGGYKTLWFDKDVDINTVDYWEQPWEIEAYGREQGLYINWQLATDNTGKRFDLED